MNRRLLGIAGAALLAVLGTIAILAYVGDADDRAQAELELVEVFVVTDRVEAGADETELRRSIGTEEIAAGTVVSGVITDLEQLEGKVAAVDLVPGEQMLRSRLIDESTYDTGRARLTSVPTDKHEMTISLDPERVVGGQIVPGDTVGVIGSFDPFDIGAIDIDSIPPENFDAVLTSFANAEKLSGQTPNTSYMMLNKILVTRVQVEELPQEVTDEDGNAVDTGELAPTGNLLVTLALDAHEVERLVFTAEFGRIWLSYEPTDADESEQEVVTRQNVYDIDFDEAQDEAPDTVVADPGLESGTSGAEAEVPS